MDQFSSSSWKQTWASRGRDELRHWNLLWVVWGVNVHRGIFYRGAVQTAESWRQYLIGVLCWWSWSPSWASSPGSTWFLVEAEMFYSTRRDWSIYLSLHNNSKVGQHKKTDVRDCMREQFSLLRFPFSIFVVVLCALISTHTSHLMSPSLQTGTFKLTNGMLVLLVVQLLWHSAYLCIALVKKRMWWWVCKRNRVQIGQKGGGCCVFSIAQPHTPSHVHAHEHMSESSEEIMWQKTLKEASNQSH